MIQVAVNRYEKLVELLKPYQAQYPEILHILFMRNLSHDAKQYCLLHSENGTWETLQNAGLSHGPQQRPHNELGGLSRKLVNELIEVSVECSVEHGPAKRKTVERTFLV